MEMSAREKLLPRMKSAEASREGRQRSVSQQPAPARRAGRRLRLFHSRAPCFVKIASRTSSTRLFFFQRSSHIVLFAKDIHLRGGRAKWLCERAAVGGGKQRWWESEGRGGGAPVENGALLRRVDGVRAARRGVLVCEVEDHRAGLGLPRAQRREGEW